MYIAKSRSKSASGKEYESILLRESYREGGKVKNRTIANLSKHSKDEIRAIELALKNKNNHKLLSSESFQIQQGRSVGSVIVLHKIAEKLGIIKALGNSFHAKLALWLIIARIIEQGSRLSAARLDTSYDIASIIDLKRGFDENDLYESLHWLNTNQTDIENSLFKQVQHSGNFYWYDVTSSYFEGMKNQMAAYGYNRDKKKRKKQIVIGLLTVNNGMPISIEAFKGNTQDTQTLESQLNKLKIRFGCKKVIIVGDRGMIRKKQKKLVKEYGFEYITALTLPEVTSLLNMKLLNLDDFTSELKSVFHKDVRYIYRRNLNRAAETQQQRQERLETAQRHIDQENKRLKLKPDASVEKAEIRMGKYLKRLCISEWAFIFVNGRKLALKINSEKLQERAKFDGCYVWTTEMSSDEINDREVYERYKDLKYVEDDFRTIKTNFLEVRPIHVRTPQSTKGHLVVTLLAYMIVRELRKAWHDQQLTVQEGVKLLSLICHNKVQCSDGVAIEMIATPTLEAEKLLNVLKIKMPKTIQETKIRVVTRHKIKNQP